MGKIERAFRWIGLAVALAFSYGMIFLLVMMTWFPEWETYHDTQQTVKRHAELSKKLGHTATMREFGKSLSNVDVSTSVGFIETFFGLDVKK